MRNQPARLNHSLRRLLAAAVLVTVAAWPLHIRAQQAPVPIDLAAKTAARNDAARALVPLLNDVKRRTKAGVSAQPGTVPDSPFTGRQSTVVAITLSKRSTPVDPRVDEAMDRLLTWNIADPGTTETAALFDEWLDQLSIKSAALGNQKGVAVCDTACVVARMTKLDDAWGSSPRDRAELRDDALLYALEAVVKK